MNDTLFPVVCALAVSQLLFMMISYLLHYHKLLMGRLMGLFSLGLMSYVFLVAFGDTSANPHLVQLFRLGAILTPALLWVISQHLFQDQTHIDPRFWLLIAFYPACRIAGSILYPEGIPESAPANLLFSLVPQLSMSGFAAHAIYLAARNAKSDLVESRRQIRTPFVMIMGILIMVIVLSGFISQLIPVWINTVFVGLIFLCALALNIATFRLHQDASQLVFPEVKTHGENVTALHAREMGFRALAQRIQQALEHEQLYASPGLTIGELARTLSMPEHRLRRFINQQMGYSNFNQLLNKCRIDHASERLRNMSEAGLSISTIALETGYNSLSTFNKAFKQLHGLTPSEYRQQNSVDMCVQKKMGHHP